MEEILEELRQDLQEKIDYFIEKYPELERDRILEILEELAVNAQH